MYVYNILTDTFTDTYEIPSDIDMYISKNYITAVESIGNKIYLFGSYQYPYQARALTIEDKSFSENNLIINQSSIIKNMYSTRLFDTAQSSDGIPTYFCDVFLYKNGQLEKNNPTYYGDGTQWICFKNAPTEEVTE